MTDQPTLSEKNNTWRLYQNGKPDRVPVCLRTNDRVYVLDPRFNRQGADYQNIFNDPKKMMDSQLQWQKLLHDYFIRFCDFPPGMADKWQVQAFFHNVYEAWAFGCQVRHRPGQVPDTLPCYTNNNKRAVFDIDITRPLALEPFRRGIEFTERMMEIADGYEFEGFPVRVLPYVQTVSDGPVTVSMNLRGEEFLLDLVTDPDYADDLMGFVTQAAINRARALLDYWGQPTQAELWLADDSITLISNEMYQNRVLPHHRRFFETLDPHHKAKRVFHLCGDAVRLFPLIVQECAVDSIDTGFPVDFARLRQNVGPDIEIWGGVEVALLLQGTPDRIRTRTREILTGGVLEGKRFILAEGNNLPPRVPQENLKAMYRAALEFGTY